MRQQGLGLIHSRCKISPHQMLSVRMFTVEAAVQSSSTDGIISMVLLRINNFHT